MKTYTVINTDCIPESIRKNIAIKINIDGTECWEWLGGKTSKGYSRIYYEGKTWWGHILIRQLITGEIIDTFLFEHDHICEFRLCVNPECIKIVPKHENQKFSKQEKLDGFRSTDNEV